MINPNWILFFVGWSLLIIVWFVGLTRGRQYSIQVVEHPWRKFAWELVGIISGFMLVGVIIIFFRNPRFIGVAVLGVGGLCGITSLIFSPSVVKDFIWLVFRHRRGY